MARPYLQRVEETFPASPNEPGTVRCLIVEITAKQWTWLEPILRKAIANAPLVVASSESEPQKATPQAPGKQGLPEQ